MNACTRFALSSSLSDMKQATRVWLHADNGVEDLDYLLVENFLQAIDTDGDTILDTRFIDAVAGRAICAVVEAALESGRTGAPVDVG